MGGRAVRRAAAFVAFAVIATLARPAAALRWERVGGVPADASLADETGGFSNPDSFPNLSILPSGVGLMATHAPTVSQYFTSNGGKSWTKISDHYISGVYPVTNWVSFGIGQLGRRQRNDSEPTALLKWTRHNNKWSVSLRPPAASGAAGIDILKVSVTPSGRHVFVLGDLQWLKDGDYLSKKGPKGVRVQHVWRYSVAADAWSVVHTVEIPNVSRGNAGTLDSLAAGSNVAAWVGHFNSGRVSAFNGSAWSVSRPESGANDDYVTGLTAVAANRAWARMMVGYKDTLVWFNGAAWVPKLATGDGGFLRALTAPGPRFALATEQVDSSSEQTAAAGRLWRWDGATGAFKLDFAFTSASAFNAFNGTYADHAVHAASNSWAVFARTAKESGSTAAAELYRLEARVWSAGAWKAAPALRNLRSQYVHRVLALPGGTALAAFQGGAGVWRLA